ncbi:hypothetical protein [Thalassoporum mexicanum]|uniref:hypothetical protein n=1 Tax=Thalassoporum mexicanum TaxID=3457544 RepID=UPI00030C7D09
MKAEFCRDRVKTSALTQKSSEKPTANPQSGAIQASGYLARDGNGIEARFLISSRNLLDRVGKLTAS